jgi:hypothetical protein
MKLGQDAWMSSMGQVSDLGPSWPLFIIIYAIARMCQYTSFLSSFRDIAHKNRPEYLNNFVFWRMVLLFPILYV